MSPIVQNTKIGHFCQTIKISPDFFEKKIFRLRPMY